VVFVVNCNSELPNLRLVPGKAQKEANTGNAQGTSTNLRTLQIWERKSLWWGIQSKTQSLARLAAELALEYLYFGIIQQIKELCHFTKGQLIYLNLTR